MRKYLTKENTVKVLSKANNLFMGGLHFYAQSAADLVAYTEAKVEEKLNGTDVKSTMRQRAINTHLDQAEVLDTIDQGVKWTKDKYNDVMAKLGKTVDPVDVVLIDVEA